MSLKMKKVSLVTLLTVYRLLLQCITQLHNQREVVFVLLNEVYIVVLVSHLIYLARHLSLKGWCQNWLAWYQCSVTGSDSKFDLQPL